MSVLSLLASGNLGLDSADLSREKCISGNCKLSQPKLQSSITKSFMKFVIRLSLILICRREHRFCSNKYMFSGSVVKSYQYVSKNVILLSNAEILKFKIDLHCTLTEEETRPLKVCGIRSVCSLVAFLLWVCSPKENKQPFLFPLRFWKIKWNIRVIRFKFPV